MSTYKQKMESQEKERARLLKEGYQQIRSSRDEKEAQVFSKETKPGVKEFRAVSGDKSWPLREEDLGKKVWKKITE